MVRCKYPRIANLRGRFDDTAHAVTQWLRAQLNCTIAECASMFNVSRATIHRRDAGETDPNAKRGPKPGTVSEATAIKVKNIRTIHRSRGPHGRRQHYSVRKMSRKAIHLHGKKGYSKSSVHRNIKKSGGKHYLPFPAPSLTQKETKYRSKFARKYRKDKRMKIFVDEAWVTANHSSSHGFYKWSDEDDDARDYVRRADQYPKKVFIFGCLGPNGFRHFKVLPVKARCGDEPGWSLNADRYIRMCLAPIVPKLVELGAILVHDGASCHTAKQVSKYLEGKGVSVFELHWPAHSPDLNPVENLHSIIAGMVDEMGPDTPEQLARCVREAYERVPNETIENLYNSWERRCTEVILAKGEFATKRMRMRAAKKAKNRAGKAR